MAKYKITAPDGKVYFVEGDGTAEEALAHFKANYKAPVAQNDRDLIEVGSRPLVKANEEGAARLAYGPKTTKLVPQEGPVDRAIYEAGGTVTDALSKIGLP